MANPNPSKPFVKGDSRINRKGRPRDFDALRELAQQIAHEAVNVGDHKMTVTEAILRQWAQSKNTQLQKGFLEIAYGKVPDEMKLDIKDTKFTFVWTHDYANSDENPALDTTAGDDNLSG